MRCVLFAGRKWDVSGPVGACITEQSHSLDSTCAVGVWHVHVSENLRPLSIYFSRTQGLKRLQWRIEPCRPFHMELENGPSPFHRIIHLCKAFVPTR